ncbi:MAG: hypothetical protein GMKNLPBB_00439 [Myxococcota bacterium]|nr:hypothetical protein [Myxococcota bacterium]
MPMYEYRCEACKFEFEEVQKFSDPLLVDCPACKAPSLKKKMSLPAFHLKGGGWYAQGYSAGASKDSASGGEKSAPSEGGGGCGLPQCATSCAGASAQAD